MGQSEYNNETVRTPCGVDFSIKRRAQVTQELKDENNSINHNDEEGLRQACQRTADNQFHKRLWGGYGAGFESPGVG